MQTKLNAYKLDKKVLEILIEREIAIKLSRQSFWHFCKTLHGYKEEWTHLKIFCDILQQFYERKLINKKTNKPYTKLMVNMPPRHFKTRTLVLFSCWTFGRNIKERIIATAYSDDLATDFSRYTRDEIDRAKNFDYEIIYNDIFPNTKLQKDNASYKKWALDGQHFSYKGSGIGGGITGKGCTIGIMDDQIKNYEEAVNSNKLEKNWNWYTGTFKSRLEENSLEVICMTRWSEKDICGMILKDSVEKDQWYQLKFEVYNKKMDKMLCDEMLSKDSYLEKQRIMDSNIFYANYHQITIEKKGRLYRNLKTYDQQFKDPNGNVIKERIICYIDSADEGKDYLCAIFGYVYVNMFYFTDVVYTQEPQEITENMVVEKLIENETKDVKIESQAGGKSFARNIVRMLNEKQHHDITVDWFHQSKNKKARILSNASNVERRILFPVGWNYKYPEFYEAITSYMKNNKGDHDDAPDAITGIIEMLDEGDEAPIFTKGIQ